MAVPTSQQSQHVVFDSHRFRDIKSEMLLEIAGVLNSDTIV